MKKKDLTHKDVKKLKKEAEDKTFGMKNKKSKNVDNNMANTKGGLEKFMNEQIQKKKEKKEQEEEKKFMAELYGTGISAAASSKKDDESGDPKKKVCPFFKAGVCEKGKRCKLSHQMDEEQQAQTLNIYMDPREAANAEGGAEEDPDNIKNWDTKKLEEVVNFNSKKYDTNKPTDIVCKHFLDAIEKKIYGWFWVCPNGGYKCIYRHALPQGYVLKRDLEALKDGEGDEERLEDAIDKEIYNLDRKKLTPLTHEKFIEWKKKRMERKKKEQEERLKADLAKAGHKQTKGKQIMSGKSLFIYQPGIFTDDLEAADDMTREDLEENNTGEKGITHNYEEYLQDNFKKQPNEGEMEEDKNEDEEKVQIDENAFEGEEGLDDLPDDI